MRKNNIIRVQEFIFQLTGIHNWDTPDISGCEYRINQKIKQQGFFNNPISAMQAYFPDASYISSLMGHRLTDQDTIRVEYQGKVIYWWTLEK